MNLTAREKEILKLMCQEFSSKMIADQLGLALKTVEVHRYNIMKKTGAKNFAGMIMFAIRNGLVTV